MVLLFAFFGLLALVIVRASPRGNDYENKRAKVRSEKLEAAQKETMTALTTYGWIDKTKGVARIPITDAMKLTVAELAQKKPAPANPIATPEQSPTPATSPTPSATASPIASTSTTPKPTTVTGPTSESRNQPAAAINPPPAPPNSQPGPANTPAASPPSAATKAQVSPSPSATPSAPASPLPVRGKTP